jgi:hypothetical protein
MLRNIGKRILAGTGVAPNVQQWWGTEPCDLKEEKFIATLIVPF